MTLVYTKLLCLTQHCMTPFINSFVEVTRQYLVERHIQYQHTSPTVCLRKVCGYTS